MRRLFPSFVPSAVMLGSALPSSSCAPKLALDIFITELDDRVVIGSVGDVDCLAFVNSPEVEQRFELTVGRSSTYTSISQPIEVSAVKL